MVEISPNQPTWGSFQSLLQLSIGLNGTFAVLATYVGDGLLKESKKIDRLINQLKDKVKIDTNDVGLGAEAELSLLSGECEHISENFSNFVSNFIRVSCILFTLLGIAGLIYSSYVFEAVIKSWEQMLVCGLLTPFLIGVAYSMFTSFRGYLRITSKRKGIEQKLRRAPVC